MNLPQVSTLILILWNGRNVDGSDVNSLELLHEDLSKLSRVTNAIALESAALLKSVKVREVITELLQVHTGNFSKLVELDPTFLIKTLDALHDTSTEISRRGQKASADTLREVASFTSLLDFVASESFDEENYPTSTEIMDEVRKSTSTILVCDVELVNTLSRFYHVLRGHVNKDHPELETINKVRNSKNQIKDCISKISSYNDNVSDIIDSLSRINSMKDIIDAIESLKNMNSVSFSSSLTNFKTAFLFVSKIVKNKHEKKAAHVIETASESLRNMMIGDHAHHSHHFHLTAGFPEKGDMAKVKLDLVSDWFKEKISRGKSTKQLESYLDHFAQFADRMKKVEESWDVFRKGFRKAESLLTEMTLILKTMESYDYNKNDEQFFENTRTAFKVCAAKLTPNYPKTMVTEFLNGYGNLSRYIDSINAITEWSDEMNELTSSSTAFNTFLDELEKMKTDDQSAKITKEDIKQLANEEIAENVFKMFEDLKKHQENHQQFSTETEKVSVSIDAIGKASGIFEISRCLKSRKFDAARLGIMITYMGNINNLTKPGTYEELKAILTQFSTMRIELSSTEEYVKGVKSRRQRDASRNKSSIIELKDSIRLSDHLGNGMRILKEMIDALNHEKDILESTTYGETVNEAIRRKNPIQHVREFWENPNVPIRKMMDDLKTLNKAADSYRNGDLMTIKKVFEEAIKVRGIPEVFPFIHEHLDAKNTDHAKALENSGKLKDLDLEFSSHKGELSAASLSLDNIKAFFDDFFELSPKKTPVVVEKTSSSPVLVIIICISILLVLVIGALVAYGFTSSGSQLYKKLYIYYFGKPQDYEKRWRYSLFLDRTDGKNVLNDAVREINSVNLMNAVKKGAYINVCNKFGNTPLHVATRRGYNELVEILIKNGADRNYLNVQNKTPEQMIPENYATTEPEKIDRYAKIEQIYNKYRNKNFKQRVPDILPINSFHIFIEERTDDQITNSFTVKFQHITSDEVMPTTTHCIVKTVDGEIFETDDINLLAWIFNGIIIVKDTWMTECIRDKKLIAKDCNYLVEKVKYNGVVYDTVIQWSNAMAKGTIPYLYGVHVVIVMKECANLATLANIVSNQGGTVLDSFPEKEGYRKGAHPYLHNSLGPIFLIHDGTSDLTIYKNDPDKMFTLFTEPEFLIFMLKRETNVNSSPKPLSILVDDGDE